jgi:3-hydroxyacyl-CoA dehydrogenase/enoyl-CoA hydratase/3-hydroxybutyryl-CoA epimerase
MTKFFTYETGTDGVAILTFDRPDKEMNILSEDVLRELNDHLIHFGGDLNAKGMVITSGKEGQFIVGADITEIQRLKTEAEAANGAAMLQALFSKIAGLPKPVVAAINGTCLGGGFEMSLACSWRVANANPKTKMGLPEIQLGLLPGAGGTQRLPRLIGIQAGLDMILTGKRVDGARALKVGLVDACVPDRMLLDVARQFALKGKRPAGYRAVASSFSQRMTALALESNPVGRRFILKQAHKMVMKQTKGFYPAAFKAIESVIDGFDLPIGKGLELEAKLFGSLVPTRESKSLIHLFHATTAIKKHAYKDAGKEKFSSRPIKSVGVVGAGFMGAGIATVCADKGIRVLLSDPSAESLGKALGQAASFFGKKLKRRRLKKFELDQRMVHISPGLNPAGFNRCDIVIEAVFEDVNLKRKILAQLESQNIHDDWIFASNTSALPIHEIAAESKHPERVLGMHFFSPVEKMPLLEIVITEKTAPWAVARAFELGNEMNKQIIIVKDGPGFYTTRALAFFLAEASLILSEGAKIETIDGALTGFGFPVGPITLIDEVGIDVGTHVLETMDKAFPDRMKAPPGLDVVKSSGRLGRKNGKGFYLYEKGEKRGPDPEIYKFLDPKSASSANATPDEIAMRCVLVFVNESARCLEEEILPSAYEGDVGAVFGLGFPPFLGGPFRYVDHIGAAAVVEKLRELEAKHGSRFKPAKILVQHAEGKKLFFPDEG